MAIDDSESYYNNLLLENFDNSIPVVRTTETPIRPIPEKNASKSSSSGISTLEKFIDRKYDEAALNQLKQELLNEIKQHIDKMENNNYLSDYIKSLPDQIQTLKSEVVFLRTELSGKKETVNILVDSASRTESGNITTDIHYNAKNNENKITKEVFDIEEPPQQNNEDNEGLRNEDNSNALEFTTENNADRDNSSILQEGTDKRDKRSSTIEKKNIFILGDSIVKHIHGWEMNKKLNNKHKVFVRSFSGAKTPCMRDYIKPCLRENSHGHLFLHMGTNDLPSVKPEASIARSIITLAQEVIAEKRSVSISSIILRNGKWNNKIFEVTSCLKKLCDDAKIDYLDGSININPQRHLNNSKLHLNTKGSGKLFQNFVTFIKKTFSA